MQPKLIGSNPETWPAVSYGNLSELYLALGKLTEAIAAAHESIVCADRMRLHLADYHLASSRLALAERNSGQARAHLEKAETLIKETGYHRRDSDIEKLRAELAS